MSRGIEWKHSPPRSPHWGGLWERVMKEAKKHIAAVWGKEVTDVDTLWTALVEIERILNNRPLTYGSTDIQDLSVLTPASFLYPGVLAGSSTNILPPATPAGESLRLQWQKARSLVDQFWDRWHLEYLRTLQQRNKWQKLRADLYVGQLVLMVDDGLPRDRWRIARVERVEPSASGVRRVHVRTAGGKCFERHTRMLVALELE